MYKLVVLFAFVAVAAAKPGYLHSAHVLPAAVSHSSRVDVHHAPIVTAVHSAPLVHAAPAVVAHAVPAVHAVHAVHAVPALHATPVVAHAIPAAVSHSSRVDVHHGGHVVAAPVVAAVHAAPVFAHAIPAVHSVHHGVHGHHAGLSLHPY